MPVGTCRSSPTATATLPGDPTVQQNIVFFPAYPMLVRIAGRLLGGDMIGYVAAGMIVSIAAFFGALVYLYAFTRERYGDEVATRHNLAARRVSVRDFFRRALHRVALPARHGRRLCTISRDSEFGRAACWGVLVGLTRLNGALLVLPLAMLAIALLRLPRLRTARASRPRRRRASGLAHLRALHLEAHRQSLAFATEPDRVGPDLPGPWHAGGPAVLDPRQRRLERLRRHAGLRRAERDRRAVRHRRPSGR